MKQTIAFFLFTCLFSFTQAQEVSDTTTGMLPRQDTLVKDTVRYTVLTSKHTVFLHVGLIPVPSLVYDRVIAQRKQWKWSVQGGIGSFPFYTVDFENKRNINAGFFIGTSAFVGRKKHYFEVNTKVGMHFDRIGKNPENVLRIGDSRHGTNVGTETYYLATIGLGYRYQQPKGGFYFSGMLNVVNFYTRYPFFALIPMPTVGIGYTFRK